MIFLRLHNAPSDSGVLLPTFAFDVLDLFEELLLLLIVIFELNRE